MKRFYVRIITVLLSCVVPLSAVAAPVELTATADSTAPAASHTPTLARRVEVAAFVVLAIAGVAFAVHWLWNGLRLEISGMPEATWGRTLWIVTGLFLLGWVILDRLPTPASPPPPTVADSQPADVAGP